MVDVIVGGSKGRMGSVLVDSIMKNEVNMCVLGGIDPLNTDEKYKTLEGFLNSEMFSYIKKVQKKEEKNIVYVFYLILQNTRFMCQELVKMIYLLKNLYQINLS